ncbi:MAG: Uncharacterised protein [Cyanobium sp. ARS6]|nr:MAG: Uncharacterised protein [Cyanobium sp. ARS6]
MQLFQQLQSFNGACHCPVPCGGDARFPHQSLGPRLARFELSSIGAWSKHRQTFFPQTIGHTGGQWGFRADHHQIDRLLPTGLDQPLGILFRDGQRAAVVEVFGSSVSGSDPDRFNARAAAQGPGQSLFTATTAHHEQISQRWQGLRTGAGMGHGGKRFGQRPLGLGVAPLLLVAERSFHLC